MMTSLRSALIALHIAESLDNESGAHLSARVASVLLRVGYIHAIAPGTYRLTSIGKCSDPTRPPLPDLKPTERLALEWTWSDCECVACGALLGRELAASFDPEADSDDGDRELICLSCARRLLMQQADMPDYEVQLGAPCCNACEIVSPALADTLPPAALAESVGCRS
ncbi:MAG TPA: hypothetical protein VFX49_11745 [Chloroflexota bacterium]|nr:hypothetical protein [Chloroflexota bacterium]